MNRFIPTENKTSCFKILVCQYEIQTCSLIMLTYKRRQDGSPNDIGLFSLSHHPAVL